MNFTPQLRRGISVQRSYTTLGSTQRLGRFTKTTRHEVLSTRRPVEAPRLESVDLGNRFVVEVVVETMVKSMAETMMKSVETMVRSMVKSMVETMVKYTVSKSMVETIVESMINDG